MQLAARVVGFLTPYEQKVNIPRRGVKGQRLTPTQRLSDWPLQPTGVMRWNLPFLWEVAR